MIDSLEMLERRRYAMKHDLRKSEKKLAAMWNEMVHGDGEPEPPKTKVQKILGLISDSSVVIDGFILGWKLYRRFKRKKK